MKYAIRYAPQALRDMDAVWDGVYAASQSVTIAQRYVEEFVAEIASVKTFPFSGIPLQYRGLFTGFYSVTYKKYKAFYRVRDGYIEVVRIIYAGADYTKILFDQKTDEQKTAAPFA